MTNKLDYVFIFGVSYLGKYFLRLVHWASHGNLSKSRIGLQTSKTSFLNDKLVVDSEVDTY